MDENKPRRHWLSFGTRDLLWMMVVVGLAAGWWQTYLSLQKAERRLGETSGIGRVVQPPPAAAPDR
jgi:hypothetical protein